MRSRLIQLMKCGRLCDFLFPCIPALTRGLTSGAAPAVKRGRDVGPTYEGSGSGSGKGRGSCGSPTNRSLRLHFKWEADGGSVVAKLPYPLTKQVWLDELVPTTKIIVPVFG